MWKSGALSKRYIYMMGGERNGAGRLYCLRHNNNMKKRCWIKIDAIERKEWIIEWIQPTSTEVRDKFVLVIRHPLIRHLQILHPILLLGI